MNNYPIHITTKINEEKLQKGLFIFMIRASRIPPHLGVIVNGKLYDISAVGPNIALPIHEVYKTIIKRKTEVIFFALKKKLSNEDLTQIITEKVKKYWKVTKKCTCLVPVKEFVSKVYDLDVSETNFIFELLPILYHNGLIKEVSQVNLLNKMVENIFYLEKYTKTDIENCINTIHRKEKIVC